VFLGRKDHIPRFHNAESIRRNAFMPERMIRTALSLTSWSAPMCPIPSPRDQCLMHETHDGGSTGAVDDLGAVDNYAPASRPSRQLSDDAQSILRQPLALLCRSYAPISCTATTGEGARNDRLKRRPTPTADPTRPRLLANNATGARLLLDIELLSSLMRDPAPLSGR